MWWEKNRFIMKSKCWKLIGIISIRIIKEEISGLLTDRRWNSDSDETIYEIMLRSHTTRRRTSIWYCYSILDNMLKLVILYSSGWSRSSSQWWRLCIWFSCEIIFEYVFDEWMVTGNDSVVMNGDDHANEMMVNV